MTGFEREVARARRQLLARDSQALREATVTYRAVIDRLRGSLRDLTRRITAARLAGEPVSPAWLARERRYLQLIDDLERDTAEWAGRVQSIVTSAQQDAIRLAREHAPRLTLAAFGPGPQDAHAIVGGMFDRAPVAAVAHLVARATSGPLAGLLLDLAPDGAQRVREALAFGVASGRGPRAVARLVRDETGETLTRALGIARTETLGAYRAASLDAYRSTGLVETWTWYASADERTCPVCLAMHGRTFPISQGLESHPQCRCTMVPNVPSWRQLGIDVPDERPAVTPGPALFARMSAAEQARILGPSKHAAYQAGRLKLEDLPVRTVSARWGPGLREASLRELGIAQEPVSAR